ncbi:hypothetical protein [Nonomuraea sp. NPDC048916]|uniref:hypothetical protein n=1 Tax=Nonomuraea sp. NPDC048916 TaxID=3154232 RepID=UPI0033C40DC6
MSFEEQLLMDLKAEFAAREERRRRTGRRLFTGAAAATLAAAAAIAVPLLTAGSPAYAVSENTDGTITVLIKEFRDADKLEQDLKAMGVTADVTYLKPGKACEMDRGRLTEGTMPMTVQKWTDSVHHKAASLTGDRVDIDPDHIGKDQTLVMEIAETDDHTSDKPRDMLRFRGLLIAGPVKPCTVIDADYELRGGPARQSPAGS